MPTETELVTWIEAALRELHTYRADHPDQTWSELQSYFLQQLGISDVVQYPVIDALVRDLEQRPENERAELLSDLDRLNELGEHFASQHAEPAPAEQQPAFDQNAWLAFLAECGPTWNGTDEHWAQFEPWLLGEANSRGFGPQTEALFAQVRGRGAAAVIELFRQYGVTIQAPAQQQQRTQASPEELAESAVHQLLAENPQFANIPADRRRELVAEVLAEMAH
jgi:hypothetical protein